MTGCSTGTPIYRWPLARRRRSRMAAQLGRSGGISRRSRASSPDPAHAAHCRDGWHSGCIARHPHAARKSPAIPAAIRRPQPVRQFIRMIHQQQRSARAVMPSVHAGRRVRRRFRWRQPASIASSANHARAKQRHAAPCYATRRSIRFPLARTTRHPRIGTASPNCFTHVLGGGGRKIMKRLALGAAIGTPAASISSSARSDGWHAQPDGRQARR